MNPLRVLGDLLAGHQPPAYTHPLDEPLSDSHTGPDDGCPNPSLHPACYPPAGLTTDERERLIRERLMRHTGRPECPIPEHRDALRLLGRVTMERDEARAESDLWMRRALRAEAKLRHPAAGDQAA